MATQRSLTTRWGSLMEFLKGRNAPLWVVGVCVLLLLLTAATLGARRNPIGTDSRRSGKHRRSSSHSPSSIGLLTPQRAEAMGSRLFIGGSTA